MPQRATIIATATMVLLATMFVAQHARRQYELPFATSFPGPEIAQAALPPPDVPSDGEGLGGPILLYHRITTPHGRVPYKELFVTPERFAEQIAAIAATGADVVTMDQLFEAARTHRSFPNGIVAITFDDATVDQYLSAYPVLKAFGLHATFYIPSGRVGTPGALSWEQIIRMRKDGMGIGSHTVTHAELTLIEPEAARAEIFDGKLQLENALGMTIDSFAYPFGHYNTAVAQMVRDAGFRNAVTTEGRLVHDMAGAFQWGRIEVHNSTTPEALVKAAKEAGQWERMRPSGRRVREEVRPVPRPTQLAPQPSPSICILLVIGC